MARNRLVYNGREFLDAKIRDGSMARELDASCASLAADSISIEVKSSDPTLRNFVADTPMVFYHRGRQKGTYYVKSITRCSPDHYILEGQSALSLLASRPHAGGIYAGQTVQEVVQDICGSIPVRIKSSYQSIKLYGWLPFAQPAKSSARDNLVRVLFAIGAYLGTDLDGVLRVENLWEGTCNVVTSRQMYEGGSVTTEAAVSEVQLEEYAYIADDKTDPETLFDGTAAAGDVIVFSGPMHSLEATGVTILEAGANYAKISAGTGTVTGKPYIVNKRMVTEPVTAGVPENVVTIQDATLVSLVNSAAVAKRLAKYYRSRETIDNAIVSDSDHPGQVVRIYHPYDREMVTAYIQAQETTVSAKLRTETTALIGFLPGRAETTEYYNQRIVVAESQSITIPEDVTSIRAVLIGGGDGGQAGANGEDGPDGGQSKTSDAGGKGGEAGTPGDGGRINIIDIIVQPNSEINISVGLGGVDGAAGGETTLSVDGVQYTSNDGSASDDGYTDVTTGEIYATTGISGLDGGDGGKSTDNKNKTQYYDPDDKQWYHSKGDPAAYSGADVGEYTGGLPGENHINDVYSLKGYAGAGGGAAVGSNGFDGEDGSLKAGARYATGVGGTGGDGADATAVPETPTIIGTGGGGGHGGGGGGHGGDAIGPSDFDHPGAGGKGGKGGPGGAGAPGGVILYLRVSVKLQYGQVAGKDSKWLLDRMGRRIIV